MTSCQPCQEGSSSRYSAEVHTCLITSGACRSASIDSNSGTGISPGSLSEPAICKPDKAASRRTANTSSSDSAPLTM